jgi:hypothetical protein
MIHCPALGLFLGAALSSMADEKIKTEEAHTVTIHADEVAEAKLGVIDMVTDRLDSIKKAG